MKESIRKQNTEKQSDMTAAKRFAFKLLNIMILISAAFAFTCYCFYIAGKTFLTDTGGIFITAFMLLGTTLPLVFHKCIKRLLKNKYTLFKMIYCIALCLYMFSFLIFSAYIISDSEKPLEFDERQVVVLVCGCKINGDKPSLQLAYRLDKAYELLTEHTDAICIVRGGQGDNEDYPEATVMKQYLVDKGIEYSRIYEENSSRNTVQNIENSIKLMEQEGISLDSNIICVSTDLHTSRVAMVARDKGLDAQVASSSSAYLYLYLSSLVREYMSYAKYFILG